MKEIIYGPLLPGACPKLDLTDQEYAEVRAMQMPDDGVPRSTPSLKGLRVLTKDAAPVLHHFRNPQLLHPFDHVAHIPSIVEILDWLQGNACFVPMLIVLMADPGEVPMRHFHVMETLAGTIMPSLTFVHRKDPNAPSTILHVYPNSITDAPVLNETDLAIPMNSSETAFMLCSEMPHDTEPHPTRTTYIVFPGIRMSYPFHQTLMSRINRDSNYVEFAADPLQRLQRVRHAVNFFLSPKENRAPQKP